MRAGKIRLADLRKDVFASSLGDPVRIKRVDDTFFILTDKGYELQVDISVVEELAMMLEEGGEG